MALISSRQRRDLFSTLPSRQDLAHVRAIKGSDASFFLKSVDELLSSEIADLQTALQQGG
jgi:hypothetical protein